MQVLGYDKMSGSRAAFVASSVLTPGRWWCVSQSSLKAGSAPFNLSKYSKLLFNRLPSTVPVEKIPHDLCPVPQPDTTGKAAWHQWDIKGPLPLWRGKTPKKKWMCHTGGEIGSHPQGVQTYKAVQGVSDGGSSPLCGNTVSCWVYWGSHTTCPFQLLILGPEALVEMDVAF